MTHRQGSAARATPPHCPASCLLLGSPAAGERPTTTMNEAKTRFMQELRDATPHDAEMMMAAATVRPAPIDVVSADEGLAATAGRPGTAAAASRPGTAAAAGLAVVQSPHRSPAMRPGAGSLMCLTTGGGSRPATRA